MPSGSKTAVSVRMYNVGFGDAFVVTVAKGKRQWRMLVDCGVHPQGMARPIDEAVSAVIADLGKPPRLDVVVATHHHADHISGFASDQWAAVEVGEVWVPFVENPHDPDAKKVRAAQADAAHQLAGLVEQRAQGLAVVPPALEQAAFFAVNSRGNDAATDRLLGRNDSGFKNEPKIRYLPSRRAADNVIDTGVGDAVVHVLGPPRDPKLLKRMDPPKAQEWLTYGGVVGDAAGVVPALFDAGFELDPVDAPDALAGALKSLDLDSVGANDDGLLAAASILERSVNNTSVFFVLDVGGRRFVFPGDSQEGAWNHVLDDPDKAPLVTEQVEFYKIGHHGSHNGTPKRYIEEKLSQPTYAMLPWRRVERFAAIPKKELLAAMEERGDRIVRADAPKAERGKVKVHKDLWSEITFHC